MRIDTVVVTGGSRGLGRGLVEAFLARGVNVAFCGRSQDSLAATERELSQHRARLLGVVADMARYEDAERVWAAAEQRFGAVGMWINNAGRVWRSTARPSVPFATSRARWPGEPKSEPLRVEPR